MLLLYVIFLTLIYVLCFPALFAAVEHGHLEKARTILESTDVDVNRYVPLHSVCHSILC